MTLSVVLPVYNESGRLRACVEQLRAYLRQHFVSYEILLAEDGSTDGSAEIARQLAAGSKDIVLLHSATRLGRGESLVRALRRARGDFVIYMDVDLATDLSHTRKLVYSLECGASVATGSRLMKGSRAKRPASRDLASRAYNALVRLLFGSGLHDHQCGFKGFNRRDVLEVVDWVQDNHWFWDTELLVIGQKAGLKICEFPVRWVHNGGDTRAPSKVKVLRDSLVMGRKLLQLKYRLVTRELDIAKIQGNLRSHGIPTTYP